MVSAKLVTAEELLSMGSDAPYELIEGALHEVSPSWVKASVIASRLMIRIGSFVEQEELGFVTGEQGGFVLGRDPDTVVAPDLGFVRSERIPSGYDYNSFFPGHPDLAVEVVSPSETNPDVLRKVALYAAANVPLVWVVYPMQRAVTIHALGEPPRTLGEQDMLTCGDVIPGFEVSVGEIFRLPTSK